MSMFDYILISLSLVFTIIIQLKSYEKLSNIKLNLDKVYKIIIILLAVAALVINAYTNYSITKLPINFLITFLSNYLIFKDDIRDCVIKTIIFFILVLLIETVLSFLLLLLPSLTSQQINHASIIKVSFSVLVYSVVIAILSRKFMKGFTEFLLNKKKIIINLIVSISLVFIIIVAYGYSLHVYNQYAYLVNITMTICFTFIISLILYNYYKLQKSEKSQEILLEFMKNYETSIDDFRLRTHETHNDLLFLKTYKNKNSKGYEEALNELIEKYSKTHHSFKNIYNLPSGLKGILYYKLYELKRSNINVEMLISPKVTIPLEKLEGKNYSIITKAISIILDNAKEAAERSDNKNVLIDISSNNDKIIFIIENTYKGKIDIDKIYDKKYSSKGNKRGYGLFILKSLIESSEVIELKQYLNKDRFITELYVKK